MAKEQSKRKRDTTDSSAAKRAKSNSGKPAYKKAKPDAAASAPKLLSKKEQKEAVKSKKLKFKKNYATIHETVLLWEQLRPKQTTKEDKAKLVSQILKKLQGNTAELANHHSASRVIQWCLKEASVADKKRLLDEIKTNIVPLSKSTYGRHVVQKVISNASKEEVPGLVKLFKGHVAELLRHPAGADVLDDLYSVCPQSCRNTMCAELYGREFTLFDGVGLHSENISHLSQLLAEVDPRKRQTIIEHLYKGLAPVLEKALLHPVMTHRLLRELLTEAPGSVIADVVDTLAAAGGNALKLVHTHDGAAAAAMALAYGTPKDRKRLIKGMKGYVWQTADNEWGHAVIATALSVVDDTALTSKAILGELKGHLEDMCSSKHAHRVLMQLLAPDNHRYLPPAIYEIMHPPIKTMLVAVNAAAGANLDAEDEEFVDEEAADDQQGDEVDEAAQDGDSEEDSDADQQNGEEDKPEMVERQLGESKKAADVRRQELLGSGKNTLSAAVLDLCSAQACSLLRSQVGGDVVVEVARGAAGGLLWQLQQAGVQAVHTAIVQQIAHESASVGSSSEAAGDEQQGDDEQQEPLLMHYFSSRHLRRLLLAGSSDGADGAGARSFAQQLWSEALAGRCKQLVGSHAEKVLAAVLHCGVDDVVQQATAELKPLIAVDVQEWAAKFTRPHGGAGATADGKQQQKKQQKQTEPKQSQQANAEAAGKPKKKRKKQA